ncbi:MAG TPA: polysaccharide deacetylase family protein [Firmicutes bacterium]|nr:polysaccharide deacetylase family protein [Candidatus Fermentithermobacillaceae bacterium]
MFVLKRKYLLCAALSALLWAACLLNLLGMYDAEEAMAGVAPITRGYSGKPNVTLMFNVDWGEEHIPALLDILSSKNVRATFFPTGTWAEKNPALLTRIVSEGHEIGNHGGAHNHVQSMGKQSLQRLIQSGEERIFQACGVYPSKLFAPPYGEWTNNTVEYALEMGYQTVLWTVDTVDWRLPEPEAIWKRALAGVVPGALILMHPTEPTVSALPTLIDGLREKGYTIVTVSESISDHLR